MLLLKLKLQFNVENQNRYVLFRLSDSHGLIVLHANSASDYSFLPLHFQVSIYYVNRSFKHYQEIR